MAGLGGQLLQILELGAPVSFTERVDVVHIADDRAGRLGERRFVHSAQVVRHHEAPMDICHARLDVSPELELVAVFGDLYGPDLSRPVVDILEEVAMDRPQVEKVEAARWRAFPRPLRDEPSLQSIQFARVGNSEPVSKNE
jgi:hypothetical protein